MSTAVTESDLVEVNDDAPSYSLIARLGAETFGTFVLVLLGVGVALFATVNGVSGSGLAVPLAFGIAVIAGIAAVGHVSGGHFNPAVTFGAAVAGRIGWGDVLPYWLAQVVGGTAAAGLLYILVPSGLPALLGSDSVRAFYSGVSNGFGEHSPTGIAITSGGLDPAGATFGLVPALLVEAVLTAVFVGVILGVTDKRAKSVVQPVVIGLTLAALIMVAAPITNAALNPARATATAFFSDSWALGELWLFWVAPLIGAAIAGIVYLLVSPASLGSIADYDDEELAAAEAAALADEEAEVEADAIDALLSGRAAAPVAAESVTEVEVDLAEADAAAQQAEAEEAEAEAEADEDPEPEAPSKA